MLLSVLAVATLPRRHCSPTNETVTLSMAAVVPLVSTTPMVDFWLLVGRQPRARSVESLTPKEMTPRPLPLASEPS